jgi:hypothetical protein
MAMDMRTLRRRDAQLLDWLRLLFREFNAQFFAGELPAYEIRIELLIAGLTIIKLRNGTYRQLPGSGNCLHGLCLPDEQLIFINSECSKMEDDAVREVLLHEMCHAAVYRSSPAPLRGHPHGQDFVAELSRLAALGEVWAAEHAEYYQTVAPDQQTKCPLDTWRLARRA